MGDFNAHLHDPKQAEGRRLASFARTEGLAILNGDPSYAQRWTYSSGPYHTVVDYILISADLAAAGPLEVDPQAFLTSDHRLLRADITVPGLDPSPTHTRGHWAWQLHRLKGPSYRAEVAKWASAWAAACSQISVPPTESLQQALIEFLGQSFSLGLTLVGLRTLGIKWVPTCAAATDPDEF